MKLIFVAPFAFTPKATVSARVLPIAEALVTRGHLVTILIPPYDNPTDSGKHWMDRDVHIENMNVSLHTPATLQYVLLGWQLAARIRSMRPDAIHVFKPVGPGALAMWLLSALGSRDIILDNDDWEGHGGWLDVNPYPPLQKRFMAWQERWCIRHAQSVTCASDVLITRSRTLGQNKPSLHLLPNGPASATRQLVEDIMAHRNELRSQFGWTNRSVLIYAGTVPLNHDLDIAIRAVATLRDRFPAIKWVIVAAGDGLASLKVAVTQAGLDDVSEYYPFMPHDQLMARLVAADVALYPYRDTNINRAKCSGKVVDYMACGLPTVLSNVGMNAVYVENNVSGLLTDPGSSDSFTSALVKLLDDPEYAMRIGQSAQKRLWERFGWDRRVELLEQLYRSVSP